MGFGAAVWIIFGMISASLIGVSTFYVGFKKKLAVLGITTALGGYAAGVIATFVSAGYSDYKLFLHSKTSDDRWSDYKTHSAEIVKRLEGSITHLINYNVAQSEEIRGIRADFRTVNDNLFKVNLGRETGQRVELKRLPPVTKENQ